MSPRTERAIAARDAIAAGAPPLALVPHTFLEAQAFAGALAESGLIPADLRKRAPDVLVILLAGIELGLAPMQALRLFHVIEGLPRLSADGMASIVMASPVCDYLECAESSEVRCTWITKRRGRPERSCTWTMERAKRAGITVRPVWGKYPENMLSARARAELCRIVYPDIVAGLVSREEALDGAIEVDWVERPAAFAAPPAPAPAVLPPAANTNAVAPAPEPVKRGPGRPPKERPLEVVAAEDPNPTTKIDAAIAKVEAKNVAAPAARVEVVPEPAAEDTDAFGPEPAAPAAAPNLAAYFAWLASCKTQRELKERKPEWIAWSMEHLGSNAEAAKQMAVAYATRNAEVPA